MGSNLIFWPLILLMLCRNTSGIIRSKKMSMKKEVLIIEDHQGCINELSLVMSELSLVYDVRNLEEEITFEQLKENLCKTYKNLVFSDVMINTRPILELIVKNTCPDTFFIINITNRFDYHITDSEFYDLVKELLKSKQVY